MAGNVYEWVEDWMWSYRDTVHNTEAFKDDPRKIAFLYGPLVLCSEVDPTKEIPVVVSQIANVIPSIKPVAGSVNTFTMPASLFRTFSGDKNEMKLIPFYKEHQKPYMVYWDLFSANQWKMEEASYKAELDRQKELETRTIDEMRFEMQPERDHELKSDKSRSGDQPYNGTNKYVIHFDKGQMPPVKGFWSLTLYDDQFFFVPNSLNRYNLSQRDKFTENPDGSTDLYIQHESPGQDKASNWLPAPEGKFALMLRFYWPEESIINGTWKPPAVKRAD
jgi:hypothetical protein